MRLSPTIQSLWSKHIGSGGDFNRDPGGPEKPIGLLGRIESSGHSREAIGAGLGAAVGGTIGYFQGLSALSQDTVSVQVHSEPVTRPIVIGARLHPEFCQSQYSYDGEGNIGSVFQNCDPAHVSPIVERQPTGQSIETRSLEHTHGWNNPLASAGLGILSGAAIGLAGAVLYSLLRDKPDSDDGPSQGDSPAPWVGATVGGVLGAAGGFYAGHLAEARQVALPHTVQTPVFHEERIGWVPRVEDFPHTRAGGNEILYKDLPMLRSGEPFEGGQPITDKVPTGEVRETAASSRAYQLNRVTGTLLGLGLGATVGVAAGVAGGLVQRGLDRK